MLHNKQHNNARERQESMHGNFNLFYVPKASFLTLHFSISCKEITSGLCRTVHFLGERKIPILWQNRSLNSRSFLPKQKEYEIWTAKIRNFYAKPTKNIIFGSISYPEFQSFEAFRMEFDPPEVITVWLME